MSVKDRVPPRCYYYLLDFLDRRRELLGERFGKERLCDLGEEEFWALFKEATEQDLERKASPYE